jgi:hypothetical protein
MNLLHAVWQKITYNHTGEDLDAAVARGCPQSRVLATLCGAWLWTSSQNSMEMTYAMGDADDIAILISGKFMNTVSKLLHEAFSTVQQCHYRTQLSVSPQTIVIVPFTRKRDLKSLE